MRLVFEPGPDHPGARAEALKYVASERERERNADADAGGGYAGSSAVVASEPESADPVSVWFGRLGKAWGYLKISAVCCLALGFYNNYQTGVWSLVKETRLPGADGILVRKAPDIRSLDEARERYAELQRTGDYRLVLSHFPEIAAADAELRSLLASNPAYGPVLMALAQLEGRWAQQRAALAEIKVLLAMYEEVLALNPPEAVRRGLAHALPAYFDEVQTLGTSVSGRSDLQGMKWFVETDAEFELAKPTHANAGVAEVLAEAGQGWYLEVRVPESKWVREPRCFPVRQVSPAGEYGKALECHSAIFVRVSEQLYRKVEGGSSLAHLRAGSKQAGSFSVQWSPLLPTNPDIVARLK
jgi:hypothetical protein